jgi:serine/threonine protein kinase
MNASAGDSSAQEQRVNEAIAAYLEAVDAGHAPDPVEFITKHRDVSDELKMFFADHDQFERLTGPRQASNDLGSTIRSFGDYELLEEIGRGGMGIVYRARQIGLNRIVALKMILAGQLASQENLQRFQLEAEAAASLDHPGIVPVYEVGEHNGQQYFSMGYVEGNSLAALLREGPIPAREAAMLLERVCEAVQYAHERRVIHRDLKPANILLEWTGDSSSAASGTKPFAIPGAAASSHFSASSIRPRITDFGLAKRAADDSAVTATGQILGTPSYMSPEQAAGAAYRIGPASDVYSLGAILYQCLTGRPPFQAETPLDTLAQVLDGDPVPLRLLNHNVPRDLEAICLKCLEKAPEDRYPSARDLHNDLQRYSQGEAIHASGVNLLDRVTRALRRSHHEEHFREWGLGLMAFGLVIFLSHLAIFALERTWHDPVLVYWLSRSAMFAALLVMLWRFRHHSVLPTNSAERLIWVVWIGYLLALGAVNSARFVLGDNQRESYASFAILAGLGFLVMGGHVWGGGYIVGLIFMIAAPLLAAYTDLAPVAFGALWAGALWTFGLYYWRRGRAARADIAGMSR